MNDTSIDNLIEKKYGKDPHRKIKGFDYMKKIVQLPFQIPDWVESDILNFLDSIILYEVKDSVGKDFRDNINLLVKAIEANPREVKRFVNQIILAKSVFDKPVDNLIVVQALRFNPEWRWFLDYITSIDNKEFFDNYHDYFFEEDDRTEKHQKEGSKNIGDIIEQYPSFKILKNHSSFFEDDDTLRRFLDAGAIEKLSNVNNLEEYRRALEVVSLETVTSNNRKDRKFQPLPEPTGNYPYHLSLNDVLQEEKKISDIINSGGISFHIIGNTGGIKNPEPQERIARALKKDFESYNNNEHKPSFLYLLGDIVYYNGASDLYYSQFYEPYNHYPAPIFAIPGNHDGSVSRWEGEKNKEASLTGFVRNFCATSQEILSPGIRRPTMIQPNVYWTLEAPFVTIIGLYSNANNTGKLGEEQIEWLINELKDAHANKAIILSVHHPPYSADRFYSDNSKVMANILDDAFVKSGRIVDLVISSHLNNYQRFTRQIGERQIPYIIAGAGGYSHLHEMQTNPDGSPIKVPYKMPKNDIILEKYCDQSHGFLSLLVTSESIKGTYFAVQPGQESQNIDNFELDLGKNIISKNLRQD